MNMDIKLLGVLGIVPNTVVGIGNRHLQVDPHYFYHGLRRRTVHEYAVTMCQKQLPARHKILFPAFFLPLGLSRQNAVGKIRRESSRAKFSRQKCMGIIWRESYWSGVRAKTICCLSKNDDVRRKITMTMVSESAG